MVRCQNSQTIHCFVIHFLKIERACLFETLHHVNFVEVGLPYFQGLHFPGWNQGAPMAQRKKKLGTLPKEKIIYWLYIFISRIESLFQKFRPVWSSSISNIICIFLKFMWIKKCVKIYIMLFKNLKYITKILYQTDPYTPSLLINLTKLFN